MRVGIIGCGYWGTHLARNFLANRTVEQLTVADIDPARAKALQEKFPAAQVAVSVNELFQSDRIEAVAIVTPVSTHFELAQEALRRGKHVLVEKPLCHRVEAARSLVQLAEDRQRVLAVDHTFVYTPAVRKIRELISTGEIGAPWHFDSVRVNLGPFRSDISALWDLATHDLSVLFHITDARPVSVSAYGMALTSSGAEDLAYLHLKYANGAMANIRVSWFAPAKVRQITIAGAERLLIWDDLHPQEKLRVYEKGALPPGATYELSKFGVGRSWSPVLESTEALSNLVSSFMKAVRGESPIPVSGRDGLAVVEVLAACERSIRSGGQSIELPRTSTLATGAASKTGS